MAQDELYPLQEVGVDWLADGSPTKYLADEMGCGKSVEDIKGADKVGFDHIQVNCPAIAVEDWFRKFIEWSDYGRAIFRSYNSAPVSPALVPRKSVIINSFNTAVTHSKIYKANRHGGLLLIDEAHGFKNPATMRAKRLYGANCAGFGGMSQNYDAVWLNSGTPTPNGDPRELWPHLHALRPYSIIDPDTDAPYSYGAWSAHFCRFKPGLGAAKVEGILHPDELKKILFGGKSPFMLRRMGDAFGLPPVRFSVYPMRPDSMPRELDPARWPELTSRLDAIISSAGEGDIDSQLEEEVATLRRLTGLLKVEATTDLLEEELRTGQLDRVVVFAYHIDVVNEIAKRLKQFGAGAITGATPDKARWATVDAFKAGKIRLISGQILAASTNLSLGNCRHVLFAETDWVSDNNLQAAYRCRRIDGHREPVLARILSLTGTVDDLLAKACQRKLRQSRQIFN